MSLLNYLVHYWFTLLAIPMFAAGAVAEVPTGGADVVPDAGDGSPEVSTESEGAEPAGGEGADDLPAVEATDPEETAERGQDTRFLTGPIRKVLSELKASNPEAYKQMKGILFRDKEFSEIFPQGPQEARETLQKLDELGGFEAVEELTGEVQEYRALDEAWIGGDFQTFESAINQFPDGFKKMMPQMAGKWAQIDQEGFNRYGAGIVDATLKNGQIGTSLYLLKHILARSNDAQTKQEAAQIIGGIENFIGEIGKMAAKPAVQPTGTEKNPELEAREQQITERETKQFFGAVGQQTAAFQRAEIGKEIKALAGTKQISADGVQVIQRQVMQAVMDRLNANPAFMNKYDRYCEARDAEGAKKFLNTEAAKLIPELTKKIYRGIYGQPSGTKPGQKPAGQKPNGQEAPKGWVKVSGPPDASKIDRAKTTRSMVYDSQAILSDGKKVYWGDKAPAA